MAAGRNARARKRMEHVGVRRDAIGLEKGSGIAFAWDQLTLSTG